MRRIVNAMAAIAALAGMAFPSTAQAECARADAVADPPLTLVRTIPVGGSPDSIVVDCWSGRNDVIFYDLASSKVKYLDGDSLQLTPDEIYLPHRGFDSWMTYDRNLGHTYLLQVVREFDWDNLMVTVLNRRSLVRSFSVNEEFNANSRVDFPYVVTGFAAKPSSLEIGQPGRLAVDNGHGGRLDIVDLDAVGLRTRYVHRYLYRQPLATATMQRSLGSSVALEAKHETTLTDDLAYNDRLYLMDINTSATRIRTFDVWHGGAPHVSEKASIDFSGLWPFSNGVQGLFVNGPADQLLVGTALQSFDNGFAASVRTTGWTAETLHFPHMDSGFLLADWHDPKRIFVTTFDDFGNDPNRALRLRLLYGADMYTLILEAHFDSAPAVRDMAFDPYHRRLYITSEDKIYVVQVNVGAEAPPLPKTRPAAASTTLPAPWYGGQLDAPDGRASITFPAQSVAATTEVTYGETLHPPATGSRIAVRAFNLSATVVQSGDTLTHFATPYYMTLHYDDADLGPVDDATCGLYRWNGARWLREGGAQIRPSANEVSAKLDHAGWFAILGEAPERAYLPALTQ